MGKSGNHRNKNTFKFQTFSERIANINIDVIHRVRHVDDTPEGASFYLGQAIQKWTELNCTDHFTNFKKEVYEKAQTFEQLVFHEDEVVELIKKHLMVPDSMALDALLDIVVQLARDLQTDFYRHFKEFFDILIVLLNKCSQNTELLEHIFTCLSYLFKFLWRYLVKDIKEVYSFFSPLTGKPYKEYVRNFAAESFAFLMRKVKDHSDLFDFLFVSLADSPDKSEGLGRLIFEMLKGVRYQFHSSSVKLFPIVLKKLGPPVKKSTKQLPLDHVEVALTTTLTSMLKHAKQEFMTPMVDIFMSIVAETYDLFVSMTKKKPKEAFLNSLERYLRLLKLLIDFKNGSLVAKPDEIAKPLIKMLKGAFMGASAGEELLDITAALLTTYNSQMTLDMSFRLVSLVFKTKYPPTLIYNFARDLIDVSFFDTIVLSSLLPYCQSHLTEHSDERDETLLFLTQLVLTKCPPLEDSSSLGSSQLYTLDFGVGLRHGGAADYVVSLLSVSETELDTKTNLASLWSALVCLPHVRPLQDQMAVVHKVVGVADILIKMATKTEDKSTQDCLLYILNQSISCLMRLEETDQVHQMITVETMISCLKNYSDNVAVLRMAEIYLSQVALREGGEKILSVDLFKSIFPCLQRNLSSPLSQVRLLTLKILTQFDLPLPVPDPNGQQADVFHVCLMAEKVPLSVLQYREKQMHLQKLDYNLVQNSLPTVMDLQQVPLRYLIGCLFLNFKLLWDPIKKIIVSHAQGLSAKVFWEIYGEALRFAADETEKLTSGQTSRRFTADDDLTNVLGVFHQQMSVLTEEVGHIDFINFRIQLWKTMKDFPDICEPKSKEFVPLLFRFLKNEYYLTDFSVAPAQNILKKEDQEEDMHVDDEREEDAEEEQGGKQKKAGKETKAKDSEHHRTVQKGATGALIVQLQLLTLMKNPKSLNMEQQLRQLYFDLLVHRNPGVQKVVYECLLTYKDKYLVPYKDNFDRLLTDETFRNELVMFSIDHANSIIRDEHRSQVLPILMRILYGKMQFKTGKGSTGKSHSGFRQSVVLRFLTGCTHEELDTFIQLVFSPFKQFMSDDPYKMVKDIQQNIDFEKMFPVKKMIGALTSIEIIMKKLGHLLVLFIPTLLKIIVGLSTVSGVCLESRDKLTPFAVTSMKTIRQATISRITQFIEDFDDYEFSLIELDAMFEAIVWPQVEKLHFEAVLNSNPLMKLFSIWSKLPRFFPLLGKHHETKEEITPLSCLFRLLLSKGVAKNVTEIIMDIVHNLLVFSEGDGTVQDEEGQEAREVRFLVANNTPTVEQEDGPVDRDYGVKLLLPHVPQIFQYLRGTIDKVKTSLKQNHRELSILSRISCYVTDVDQCHALVGLLLPFLRRKGAISSETEEAILTSILNLIKVLPDTQPFYRSFVKLLTTVNHRVSRTLLCDIIQVICDKQEQLKEIPSILIALNSWNKRHTEEPNYEVRLEAFQKCNALIKSMETMDTDLLLPLIYNSCYLIVKMDDMSIRESGTHCLVNIVQQFSQAKYAKKVFNELIVFAILVELKQGLRHKDEPVRHEYLTVLRALVNAFPSKSLFSDLAALRHTNMDIDFFENIKHIQMYRRAKALDRLVKHFKSRAVPKETTAAYYLPLVSSFLVNDLYKKQPVLRDAAVATMAVMCRQLPWHIYLQQLKFYLSLLPRKLENLKLIVRLIVAILNGYHFDISKSQLDLKTLPAVKTDEEPDNTTKPDSASTDSKEKKTGTDQDDTTDLPADDLDSAEQAVPEIVADTSSPDGADNKDDVDGVETEEVKIDSKPEEEVDEVPETVYKMKWKQLCTPDLATSIHTVILKAIIPQLHKILTAKAKSDDEHKLAAKKFYAEDEEIMRVPLAVAMVKLLQKLPKGTLERHLPGILLKVCQFLKSRSMDIRNTSRSTLAEVQASLGPRYFPFVLSTMKSTLQRGYQVHVLCYTVHMLLKNVGKVSKPGELDVCLPTLHQIFKEEIFGEVAEEKEVEGIVAKVFEARSSKSYESYQLMGRYVSRKALMPLINPLKQVLETTSSHKSAKKVQDVLKKVITGMMENKDLDTEVMMVFTHGLIKDILPLTVEKIEKVEEETLKPGEKPKSCLLLPVAPPRGGFKPKTSKKTNLHVLIEFGLLLLNLNLKRGNILPKKKKHLEMLDPLIPMLADCLYSKYIRMNTSALRCFCWLLKFPLPSMKSNIKNIANGMFILLKNYASAGAAKGDNFELVTMSFKAVTVLVREVIFFKISMDQLKVLLTFCEEDLYDFNRQSTAFSLLRAILKRKLNGPEVQQLIKKIEEMSITADSAHVRRECRQVALQYILDFPLGKKIQDHLSFYVSQLSYEMEAGRESALEMLATFFAKFPPNLLTEYAAFFFVPMSVALVNDESPKCKKMTALAVKSLLEKLDHNNRNLLFTLIMNWFKAEKLQHRMLAAQLVGLFVEVESAAFESHLTELLPIIVQQIEPGQYQKVESQTEEQNKDHLLYNILNSLVKIFRECGSSLREERWSENMNTLWEHIKSHLLYPHVWVQLASSQLYGLLFAVWQPEELVSMETDEDSSSDTATDYLKIDTLNKLRGSVLDFLGQMRSPHLNEDLAAQIVKNMVFIAKVAKLSDTRKSKMAENNSRDEDENMSKDDNEDNKNDSDDDDEDEEETEDVENGKEKKPEISGNNNWKKGLNVEWMIRKMVREAHHEVVYNNKQSIKRCSVFKWIAAVGLDLGPELLPSVLHIIMPPIQREITSPSYAQDEALRTLSHEVLELLKKTVGFEKYTEVYASTQRHRTARKGERKLAKAVQAVANPEIFAKRKLKKNEAKKEAKKRKIFQMRPSKVAQKRKYDQLVL